MTQANSLARSLYEKVPGLFLGTFAVLVLIYLQFHSSAVVTTPRFVHAPPPLIKHFNFGYSEVMADSLWIRSLQDFDYCDKQVAKQVCQNNSWLFRMLDAITDLSPKFRIAYASGGMALTVLITDVDGATKLFEKAAVQFPNDWPILYRAAYHYLYEVKDNKRAAELLIQAGKNGAPPWVFTLAGRLYSDAGSLELAEHVLQEMIDTKQDQSLIDRLKDKIKSMKTAQTAKK